MKINFDFIKDEKFQGAVAIIAAVIMWFTPDHVDRIIETILGMMGIAKLTLVKKE